MIFIFSILCSHFFCIYWDNQTGFWLSLVSVAKPQYTATQDSVFTLYCKHTSPSLECISTGPWLLQKLCLRFTEGPEIILHECEQNKTQRNYIAKQFRAWILCNLNLLWNLIPSEEERCLKRRNAFQVCSQLLITMRGTSWNWLALEILMVAEYFGFVTWHLLDTWSLPSLPSLRSLGLQPFSGIRVTAVGGITLAHHGHKEI